MGPLPTLQGGSTYSLQRFDTWYRLSFNFLIIFTDTPPLYYVHIQANQQNLFVVP